MSTAETAQWALRISLLGVAIALTSLVWQLVLYKLSGSRLSLKLEVGRLDTYDTLLRGPRLGARAPAGMSPVSGPAIDVAIITVTNIGRAPVSVSDIGLDTGMTRVKWRLHRSSGVGFPIAVHSGAKDTSARLDAGSSIVLIFDAWTVLLKRREERAPRPLYVRAVATPAGRRKRRSAFRRRWRITTDRLSLWDDVTVDDDARLYHVVSTTARRAGVDVMKAWAPVKVYAEVEDQWTFDGLVAAMTNRGIDEDKAFNIALQVQLAGLKWGKSGSPAGDDSGGVEPVAPRDGGAPTDSIDDGR